MILIHLPISRKIPSVQILRQIWVQNYYCDEGVLRRCESTNIPLQKQFINWTASPYNGDLLYWSQRLSKHPMLNSTKGKLLQKQEGKCRWCGLLFQDGDRIEIDHITPKSEGGGEELSNKFALHRHCHDERHAKCVAGAYDKSQIIEEPDALKGASPVLKTSRRGDPLA